MLEKMKGAFKGGTRKIAIENAKLGLPFITCDKETGKMIVSNFSDVELKGILYMIGYGRDEHSSYRATNIHLLHFVTNLNHNGSVELVKKIMDSFDDILLKLEYESFASNTNFIEKICASYSIEKELCYGLCYDLNRNDNTLKADISEETLQKAIEMFNDKHRDSYSIVSYEMNRSGDLVQEVTDYLTNRNWKISQLKEEEKIRIEKEREEKIRISNQQKLFLGEDIYHIKEIVEKAVFNSSDLIDYCRLLFKDKDIYSLNKTQQLFVIMYLYDYSNDIEVLKTVFKSDDLQYLLDLLKRNDIVIFNFDGFDNIIE